MATLKQNYIAQKTRFLENYSLPIVDRAMAMSNSPEANDRVLIVRQDAIGDYILFRNFLPLIVEHFKKLGKTVYVLGNDIWKDIALTFDANVPDHWLWMNRLKFTRNINYRINKIKELQAIGFGTVVHTSWHRLQFIDSLSQVLKPELSIVFSGGTLNQSLERLLVENTKHDVVLSGTPGIVHEFLRNDEFVSQLTGQEVDVELSIDKASLPKISLPKEPYVVVMLGASLPSKQWPAASFATVIKYLIQQGYTIVCPGSKADQAFFDSVFNYLAEDEKAKIHSYCGKLKLAQSFSLLSEASCFIGNDTGLLHAALALNIPAVIVARINHYGYFVPYPEFLNKKLFTITSADNLPEILDDSLWEKLHSLDDAYPVKNISPDAVIDGVKKVLG